MHLVFLAGTGRSGSTVLSQFLAESSDAVHLGEVRYLWERGVVGNQLCECGAAFDACDFWTEVMGKAYGDRVGEVQASLQRLAPQVDRMRHIPRLAFPPSARRSAAVAAYGELLHPLYDAVVSVSGCETLIDSSKDPSYLFALKATGRFDLRVLHLVRDSRAVAYSWTRKKLRPEIHWREEYMATHSPALSASIWLEYNLALNLYRRLDRRSALVRYEDFAGAPRAVWDRTREQIVPEMGLRAAPRQGGHSFSGNPMRFDRGPLRISLDDAWRQSLPPRERAKVTAVTSPLLATYGYAW